MQAVSDPPLEGEIAQRSIAGLTPGHLGALWSLLDLTDIDPIPERGFWQQWYTNNYVALQWNGKH